MQAPISRQVRKLLADENTARKLMAYIIYGERVGKKSVSFELANGKKIRVVPIASLSKPAASAE